MVRDLLADTDVRYVWRHLPLPDVHPQAQLAAEASEAAADISGVSGTPTFFVNGQRHHGAFDLATLSGVVRTAREGLRVDGAG